MERNARPQSLHETPLLKIALDSEIDRANLWPDDGPWPRICTPEEATERFRPTDHDLTLILPAYNEEKRLPGTIDEILSFFRKWPLEYRVLVANDCSRDHTSEIIDEVGYPFSVIDLPLQSGKGCAVRTAMLAATGRVVAFTDADLPFGLEALQQAYQRIVSNETEIVFGARDTNLSSKLVSRNLLRRLTNFGFRQVVRSMISRDIVDMQCGLKVFSRQASLEIFDRAAVNGIAFDAEVILLTHRLALPYETIPVWHASELDTTERPLGYTMQLLWQMFKIRNQARSEVFELERRFDASWNQVIDRESVPMNESIRRAA